MPRPIKTKHGDYEKRLTLPVYDYNVSIIFTTDLAHSTESRNIQSAKAQDCDALHIYWPHYSMLLFLIGKCPSGNIAHEAWHCVWSLMHGIGADFENEVVAYHIGYLTDQATNFKYDLLSAGVGLTKKKRKK